MKNPNPYRLATLLVCAFVLAAPSVPAEVIISLDATVPGVGDGFFWPADPGSTHFASYVDNYFASPEFPQLDSLCSDPANSCFVELDLNVFNVFKDPADPRYGNSDASGAWNLYLDEAGTLHLLETGTVDLHIEFYPDLPEEIDATAIWGDVTGTFLAAAGNRVAPGLGSVDWSGLNPMGFVGVWDQESNTFTGDILGRGQIVPEPASLLLLAIGGLGVALRTRRR